MTFGPSRISAAVKSRLQTSVGKRFSRFLLVAAGAVIASQVTLTICLGPLGLTAGKSAVAAWFAGAAVSYVLSRWAWERKGRPNLLKETLPFGVVAIGTAVVLTLTAKWANEQALDMGLNHVQQVLFVDAAYFLANCVTFVTRFLIFHYVLFKDRGAKVSELVAELPASEFPGARPAPVSAAGDGTASEPLAAAGSAGRVNGSPAWDEAALPEPGTRR
jgi:putative flippase GtrA